MEDKLGRYAYILGVLIAVVLGIFSLYISDTAVLVLTSFIVIFGLLVGLLNVAEGQIKDFLLYSVVLIIAAGMGSVGTTLVSVSGVGILLDGVFSYLLMFLVPATAVVSLKAVLNLAKPASKGRKVAAKKRVTKKKRRRKK
tara:strand:- start:297 stop:719 length:423 start_codon:yes stop_codon:yes gene_type:complete